MYFSFPQKMSSKHRHSDSDSVKLNGSLLDSNSSNTKLDNLLDNKDLNSSNNTILVDRIILTFMKLSIVHDKQSIILNVEKKWKPNTDNRFPETAK